MNGRRLALRAVCASGAATATLLMGVGAAGTASADGTDAGSPCASGQLGDPGTAQDGGAVRCTADERGQLVWLPDTAAVSTISQLQEQGYTLTVDRVGDKPLEACTVIEVHNPRIGTERLGSGGTAPGGTGSSGDHHSSTIVVNKSIDVSLDCRNG